MNRRRDKNRNLSSTVRDPEFGGSTESKKQNRSENVILKVFQNIFSVFERIFIRSRETSTIGNEYFKTQNNPNQSKNSSRLSDDAINISDYILTDVSDTETSDFNASFISIPDLIHFGQAQHTAELPDDEDEFEYEKYILPDWDINYQPGMEETDCVFPREKVHKKRVHIPILYPSCGYPRPPKDDFKNPDKELDIKTDKKDTKLGDILEKTSSKRSYKDLKNGKDEDINGTDKKKDSKAEDNGNDYILDIDNEFRPDTGPELKEAKNNDEIDKKNESMQANDEGVFNSKSNVNIEQQLDEYLDAY